MPDMKSLFSDKQVDAARHVRRDAERQVRAAALRGPALRASTSCSSTRASRQPYRGFQGAHKPIARRRTRRASSRRAASSRRRRTSSQIDRSYWLSGDPLPVTEQNLLRGKEVFLDRCVGCHGLEGRRQGARGARSSRRRRPTSPTRTTPAAAATPAPATSTTGSCAAGRARRWRTSATGCRVDDIWRVVLFVKTIPNGTLKPNRVPEPRDYIVWQPSKELLAWVEDAPEARGQRRLRQEAGVRSVHAGSDARLPGPRARRHASC